MASSFMGVSSSTLTTVRRPPSAAAAAIFRNNAQVPTRQTGAVDTRLVDREVSPAGRLYLVVDEWLTDATAIGSARPRSPKAATVTRIPNTSA